MFSGGGAQLLGVEGDHQAAALAALVVEGAHLPLHLQLHPLRHGPLLQQDPGDQDVDPVLRAGQPPDGEGKGLVYHAVGLMGQHRLRRRGAPQQRPVLIPACLHIHPLSYLVSVTVACICRPVPPYDGASSQPRIRLAMS